jgi:hypothetical protein
MATDIHRLAIRLKHAPKMSREMRAEYLLCQTAGTPRRLSEGTIQKLRAELDRLSHSANPAVRRFVRTMRRRYPELLSVEVTE